MRKRRKENLRRKITRSRKKVKTSTAIKKFACKIEN
jgi:hypothetical protein